MGAFRTWSQRLALAAAGVVVVLGAHAGSAPSQTPVPKTLSVTIVNEGGADDEEPWGVVDSDPPGIDCPPTCDASFPTGTEVHLVAKPVKGYELKGWNALPNTAGCEDPGVCTLTVGALNPGVDAFFQPAAGLQMITAGPGTITVTPTQPGLNGACRLRAQEPDPGTSCVQRFTTDTHVTLVADPDGGANFLGWSDFACPRKSLTCKLTLAAGERYVAARFGPVTLDVQTAGKFGAITVKPGVVCASSGQEKHCKLKAKWGSVFTLRREHASDGNFWIGGCDHNDGGRLDADVCRLQVQGDELVGAGYSSTGAVPPVRGSGIVVVVAGKPRGKVTGSVINGDRSINCGSTCKLTGLTRYDQIRVRAQAKKGSRFAGWDNGSKLLTRTIPLSSTNRIRAKFVRR